MDHKRWVEKKGRAAGEEGAEVRVGEVGGYGWRYATGNATQQKLYGHLLPVTKGFAKGAEEKIIEKQRVINEYHI